jgi:hypothetical protein
VVGWQAFAAALPVGKDDASANRSRVLFRRWDHNDNKSISLMEVDEAMKAAMAGLPGGSRGGVDPDGPKQAALSTWTGAWNSHHRPLSRWFVKERDATRRHAHAYEGKMDRLADYVERDEFRILLLCIAQYVRLAEEVSAARARRRRNGRLDADGLSALLPALSSLGVRHLESRAGPVWEAALAKVGRADGFEPFARWLVDEDHLELLDDRERHEVTELDGEVFRWAWEASSP